MYYVISLKHTHRRDKYITFWRPKNAGYCYSQEMAGIYETTEKGYHDSDSNTPILVTDADKLFQQIPYDGDIKHLIPNNKQTWETLNVKMTRNGLEKLSPVLA